MALFILPIMDCIVSRGVIVWEDDLCFCIYAYECTVLYVLAREGSRQLLPDVITCGIAAEMFANHYFSLKERFPGESEVVTTGRATWEVNVDGWEMMTICTRNGNIADRILQR
jgi:hypothetical protein